MGSFYSGFGGHKSYLGHCEDGIIYSGSGNSTPIGRYENGNIYNQFKEYVGSYSGGSIYNSSRTHIASYDGGIVYNKYLNVAVGKEQVGSYDSNPAEAAALVLLFLGVTAVNGGNSSSTKDSTTTTTTTNTTTYSSSSDSDAGCLSALFSLIVVAIIKVLPYIWWGSMTALVPLIMMIGPVAYVLAVISVLCHIAFYPYWITLLLYRIKKQISTKMMLTYLGKWFKKGPFAYKDIIELKNKPMSD